MSFAQLIAHIYSRSCYLHKTEAECKMNQKLLNKVALAKYRRLKADIDPNERTAGITRVLVSLTGGSV